MSEQDLELLITTDDPGEDALEEDNFHDQPEDPSQPFPIGREEQMSVMIRAPLLQRFKRLARVE